jgi:hypothetical protein
MKKLLGTTILIFSGLSLLAQPSSFGREESPSLRHEQSSSLKHQRELRKLLAESAPVKRAPLAKTVRALPKTIGTPSSVLAALAPAAAVPNVFVPTVAAPVLSVAAPILTVATPVPTVAAPVPTVATPVPTVATPASTVAIAPTNPYFVPTDPIFVPTTPISMP